MAADVLEQLASQASLFRARDEERLEWMKALQIQVERMTKGYKDSCNDLEREQVAGRIFQERIAELERKVHGLQQSIDDSAFILVLLDADADAYTFKDSYYLDPDGGRRAVDDLHAQVKSCISRVKPDLARLPIVVRAYANIDGMPGYLSRLGLAQSSASLWNFAKTFSQAHAGSDFVFVGSGKDMADKKIEGGNASIATAKYLTKLKLGVFKQFVHNPTCHHIIFGACHDNGYVRTLEDFQADRNVVERVTLLHSFEVGQEFRKLPLESIAMDSIFRTAKAAAPEVQATSSGFEHTTMTASRISKATTWADRAKLKQGSVQSQESTSADRPKVLVNIKGHRVDALLPKAPQAAIISWNHKIKVVGMRYCRMYQLNGSCSGGCGYSHDPLSDDEKLVYRSHLRSQPCDKRLECHDSGCIYGHNCSCRKQSCKFAKEMHGVDIATAKVWAEG